MQQNLYTKITTICTYQEAGKQNEEMSESIMAKLIKVAFPKPEEELVDFLNKCKLGNSRPMLCPKCNVVYDEKAAKRIEEVK